MKERQVLLNKRGLSHHIEMVISFSIFILFVFFVILIVQPQDTGYLTDSIVNGFYYNFVDNTSIEVVSFTVALFNKSKEDFDCFKINPLPNFITESNLKGAVVKKIEGGFREQVIHNFEPNSNFYIGGITSASYFVILSNDLNLTHPTYLCNRILTDLYDTDASGNIVYKIQDVVYGTIRKEKVISLKYLENEFTDEYENNYEELKKRLSIPSSYDFGVESVLFSISKDIPSGSEVISKDYIENVLDYNTGDIVPIRFSLKLWR